MVLAALVLWLCWQHPLFAEEIPEDLNDHFSDGRSSSVVRSASEHLRSRPRSPELYMARGRAYYDMMQFDRALADFRKAKSLGLEHSRFFGNPVDFAEKAEKADSLMPIIAAYPSKGNYTVAVRSRESGPWARTVGQTVSQLHSLAENIFGAPPQPGITLMFFAGKEGAEEFTSATSISFSISADRPDASAYGSDGYAYFFELWNGAPGAKDQQRMKSTGAHEFVHAMEKQFRGSYRIKGSGRLVGSDWWTEGLATYGQQLFDGQSEARARAEWLDAYKHARDIDKEMVLGDFQRNLEFTRLNYNTGGMMVRELIRRKGKGIVAALERAMMKDHKFYELLPEVTGIQQGDLYDQVVAGLKKSTGSDFAERQFEPPARSGFVVGDLILALNTYSPDEAQYLPASYNGLRGGRYGVSYEYGSTSFVAAGQFRHFDWRKGSRVLCRVNDEPRAGTVTLATRKKVFVDFGAGAKAFDLGACHERGADSSHNRSLRGSGSGGGSAPAAGESTRPAERPSSSGGSSSSGGEPTRTGGGPFSEGTRVRCTSSGRTRTGVVTRTIGNKVFVKYDGGGADVIRQSQCRRR